MLPHGDTQRCFTLYRKKKKHTLVGGRLKVLLLFDQLLEHPNDARNCEWVTCMSSRDKNWTLPFNVSIRAHSKLFFSRKPSSSPSLQYASSNIRSSPYWRLWENGDHLPLCSSWSAKKKTNMGKKLHSRKYACNTQYILFLLSNARKYDKAKEHVSKHHDNTNLWVHLMHIMELIMTQWEWLFGS